MLVIQFFFFERSYSINLKNCLLFINVTEEIS